MLFISTHQYAEKDELGIGSQGGKMGTYGKVVRCTDACVERFFATINMNGTVDKLFVSVINALDPASHSYRSPHQDLLMLWFAFIGK